MNNKKNLKMKPVGSEYMEQYNALLRYVFQVTEQELSSIGWQEREIIRAKFPTMEKADVIGWFDDDNLVSQVAVYPMQTRIFGRTYAMGGLTGVGTYPEYSNMGLMHKLLEQALKNMKERGQDICYLYPYSIPYSAARDGRSSQTKSPTRSKTISFRRTIRSRVMYAVSIPRAKN